MNKDTIDGMRRAVDWIEEHADQLGDLCVRIVPDSKFGAYVYLGIIFYFYEGDSVRDSCIKSLFAGRPAEVRTDDDATRIERHFTVNDAERRLQFRWTTWQTKQPEGRSQETEQVLIGA